ncbi:Fic family protein [Orbaceae bacterium ac157xtp]
MPRLIKPPKFNFLEMHKVWNEIISNERDNLSDYINIAQSADEKGRYIPYDKFQYNVPKHLNKEVAWKIVKSNRQSKKIDLFEFGDDSVIGSFILTPNIQKALSETDRNATTAVLQWMTKNIGEEHYLKYLLDDLVEDESISSSQLEGAATTTLDAKRLLKKKRAPRTIDEKMVIGNFNMMSYVWEKRNEPLSIEFIKKLHKKGVCGINDKEYSPGQFRTEEDNVVVVNYDDEIVHSPPKANNIEMHLNVIVNWANSCHDDANGKNYIHPLIKAIILHFCIGYEHPFKDGNGRVARALFYWFMFKNNYSAFRYIAISTLIKSAPVQYGKAYLRTESDDLDLTYFIEHQCRVVVRGINKFKEVYEEAIANLQSFDQWMWTSGLYSRLSDKQRVLLNVAKSKITNHFTAQNVSSMLGCSYNTAAKALQGLVDMKIFKVKKVGREAVYSMMSIKSIQENNY